MKKTSKLKDVTTYIARGITPKYTNENGVTVLNQKCIRDNAIIYANSRLHDIYTKKMSDEKILRQWDVLINSTGVGTAGRTAQLKNSPKRVITADSHVTIVRPNIDKIHPGYLGYYLSFIEEQIESLAEGSTGQTEISRSNLGELNIEYPESTNEQKAIYKILSKIDSKIIFNNRINDNLYSIGETLFKEKIDSNSYAEKRKLRSFFPVVTGKKDANAATEDGKYPFFTCSRQISRINDYTFDSSAILLAGNGDFNVKFYRGKFDAYQRTYVLIPEDKLLLGYLYWAISIKLSDITSNFRGSVIRFITKGNIEDYEVAYLPDPRILNQFQSYLEMIEANNLENERLTKLRDTLLPELLNGKIDISNIDI
jgi:restriction modification system DNA specificity domain protein